jgi:hypothetical protein
MNPKFIMLHHSFSPDHQVTSDWAAIERFHTSFRHGGDIITEQGYYALLAQHEPGLEKPWLDIGYHAGVEREVGRVIAHLGRPWDMDAAACPQGDMNRLALHACIVGNYDNSPPDAEMLDVLVRRIVRPWRRLFNIPAHRIIGHRDYNPAKSCPGVMFDIETIRRMAA